MWVAFVFAKVTQICFSKNTCELDIVLTRTVNILTTNELVSSRRFEQLGPDHWTKNDRTEFGYVKCLEQIIFFCRKRNFLPSILDK